MRFIFFFVFLFTTSIVSAQSARTIIPFDRDWKFYKGDITGGEKLSLNEASWRSVDIPHDWSIEGPYDRNNPTSSGGGYLPAGIGWYRKTFPAFPRYVRKKVFIEFDGIMANSDVWINGHHLGKRPNGYVSFEYELTPYLVHKGKNILAVRADNSIQPASRWYTGAGIYRHARMIVVDPVYIDQWGSFVTTSNVSQAGANVSIQTSVVNGSRAAANISLHVLFLSPDGKEAGSVESSKKIASGKNEIVHSGTLIKNPLLWDPDHPQLYKAVTTISINNKVVDEVTVPFGIRDAHFEAATGFWLNGKNIKIKGVCLHHDGGAVGAAVPLSIWEKRLHSLKNIGVNAIRTSHNAAAPEFLDACDRLGFLVMDETFDTWNEKKPHAEKGYNLFFTGWWERDTRDIVMRDRNHPSIIIYSVGNEIHDKLNDSAGFKKYAMQQDLIHALDPMRPVTMALFRPALSKVYETGFAERMDIVGQNYRENELIAAHEKHPDWKVIGTENTHVISMWIALRDKPYMSGQFLWTGYDYLGESEWPRIASPSGLFDKTGAEKLNGYQRESWWSDKPVVYVTRKEGSNWTPDWTPEDMDVYTEAQVQAFSNCDEVELFLNGKSVGVQPRTPDNASARTWTFPYEKGTLTAVGRNGGKIVTRQELKTTGKPVKIILEADQPSVKNTWDDVVYVRAFLVDENDNRVLNADRKISFDITGAGMIAAVDNGDNSSTEPYHAKERWTYKGTCIALVKANSNSGKITVRATGDDVEEGVVTIEVKN
jgi:beta-galactosidase